MLGMEFTKRENLIQSAASGGNLRALDSPSRINSIVCYRIGWIHGVSLLSAQVRDEASLPPCLLKLRGHKSEH